MKNQLILLLLLGIFTSCNQGKEDRQPLVSETKNLAESSMETPELSIYNLPSTWTTQNNTQIELEDLRGKVLVITMIYTSCTTACPQLIAGMRNIENQLPEETKKNVKFISVSIDPETDTPERLKEFVTSNNLDEDRWVFLRGTPEDTREFATVLAVSYKQISPMDFSHSNIISVFDEKGVLVFQKEGLGMEFGGTVHAIIEEVNN